MNKKTTGIALIVAAGVLWVVLPGIPFLPLSTAEKGGLATADIVIAEVLFWIGCYLLGAQYSKQLKYYINPLHWFSSRRRGSGSATNAHR